MHDYTEIGYTKKVHGLQGEIKVNVKDKYLEDFLMANCVFLDLNGSIIPHFVESVRNTKHILVKFEDVDGIGDAEKISGKKILLRDQDLIPEAEKMLELEVLEYAFAEGFELREQKKGRIGVIRAVEDFPQQEMAVVDKGEEDILIPMIPQFIVEINKEEEYILMELPDGLV